MNEILSNSDQPNSNSEISFAQYQHVYHKLTGKTDTLKRYYRKDFIFSHADISQLNNLIIQAIEQYDVKLSNCAIEVSFCGDSKLVFSSYEKFNYMDTSKASAVRNVKVTYDFLRIMPGTTDAQAYKIEVTLISKAAYIEELESSSLGLPSFFRRLPGGTAELRVVYVDYSIASYLETVVNNWFKTVEVRKTSKLLSFFQSYSHNLHIFARSLAVILFGFLLWDFKANLAVDPTSQVLQRFIIVFVVGAYVLDKAAMVLSRVVENAIDSIAPLSCILITAGDKKYETVLRERNNKSAFQVVLSFIGYVTMGIVTSYVSGLLLQGLNS